MSESTHNGMLAYECRPSHAEGLAHDATLGYLCYVLLDAISTSSLNCNKDFFWKMIPIWIGGLSAHVHANRYCRDLRYDSNEISLSTPWKEVGLGGERRGGMGRERGDGIVSKFWKDDILPIYVLA